MTTDEWLRYHRLMNAPVHVLRSRPHAEERDHVSFFLSRPVTGDERDVMTNHGLSLDPRFIGGEQRDAPPQSVLQVRFDLDDPAKSLEDAKRRVLACLRELNERLLVRRASEDRAEKEVRVRDEVRQWCEDANASGWPTD